jgi:hypothetical protein
MGGSIYDWLSREWAGRSRHLYPLGQTMYCVSMANIATVIACRVRASILSHIRKKATIE